MKRKIYGDNFVMDYEPPKHYGGTGGVAVFIALWVIWVFGYLFILNPLLFSWLYDKYGFARSYPIALELVPIFGVPISVIYILYNVTLFIAKMRQRLTNK